VSTEEDFQRKTAQMIAIKAEISRPNEQVYCLATPIVLRAKGSTMNTMTAWISRFQATVGGTLV